MLYIISLISSIACLAGELFIFQVEIRLIYGVRNLRKYIRIESVELTRYLNVANFPCVLS